MTPLTPQEQKIFDLGLTSKQIMKAKIPAKYHCSKCGLYYYRCPPFCRKCGGKVEEKGKI